MKFLLPVDNAVAAAHRSQRRRHRSGILWTPTAIPDGWMGLDIGPKTQRAVLPRLSNGAGTVVWNGPMGVSEWDNFAERHHSCGQGCG